MVNHRKGSFYTEESCLVNVFWKSGGWIRFSWDEEWYKQTGASEDTLESFRKDVENLRQKYSGHHSLEKAEEMLRENHDDFCGFTEK